VVVTRGYTTAGDGGDGVYRADSVSTAVIDGVKIHNRSAGGRYILQETGVISAKQAGAVGNGSTDDRARLQALLNACVNMTAQLDPLSYLCVGGLIVPDGVSVIAHGASITCNTSGSQRAIDMGSNTSWDGGNITCNRLSGGDGSTNDHCVFRFGDWFGAVNQGVSKSALRNVTLSVAGDYPASSVFITQDSHDIILENIDITDSATLDDGIVMHWGLVDSGGNYHLGTRHPHNITIRNVNIGELTHPTRDGGGISVSASYNIDVSNVRIKRCRYALYCTDGDHGFKYSGFTQQDMGSVKIDNITCMYVYNAGMYLIGADSPSADDDVKKHFQNFTISNCTLVGANNGDGQGGLYMENLRNVTFLNMVIAGHNVGTIFAQGCENITFNDCLFSRNRQAGFYLNEASTKNITVRGCRFRNNGYGASGAASAGIQLLAGSFCTVERCTIGDNISELSQEVGLKVVSPFVGATIIGNFVPHVKGGGINMGYYLGEAADTGQLQFVNQNTVSSGITVYGNGGATSWIPGSFPNCIQILGNADFTYLPHQQCRQLVVKSSTPLTANRVLTLSTSGAIAGESVTFTRNDAGAFNFSVLGKNIPANAWVVCVFDGSAWNLKQYGLL